MRAMAGRGRQQEGIVWLLGRDAECADIDRLLDDARAGAGAALVVRGEPGIGKSALLDYARRRAASMTLLSAAGVQAESDLAFAGLHGLLRPVLAQLRELPQPQSAALAGALGLAPSRQADRLLISAAVLGLLAAAAEDGPVLCVVDDAHWMDRPSADALVFAARRLQAERLAMVFAAREGEVERFEAAGLPDLTLAGLDPPSATAVLAAGGHAAAGEVRERLLAEAGGNPLALLELPHGLSQAQLDGRATLPDAIPLSPRLEGVFRQRIGRLPVTAQTALLIAAADTTGDVPAVLRAMAGLGLPPDTLDPAEGAALVRISGMTITFRHPLVRSAVYQGATMSQRQRVHAALAGAFTGDEHADRRVWHQALATLAGDEEVAAALETSARRSRVRAAHSSAATAFLRAAELSTDQEHRTRRVAEAAQAAWDAGQPERAREAIARALPVAGGAVKARLLQLSGALEGACGSVPLALTRLLEAADASSDPPLTLRLLVDASEAAVFSGQLAQAVELSQRAGTLPAATARDRLMLSLLGGFAKVFAGDPDGARPLLEDVLREADALEDDPRMLGMAATAASTAGRAGDGLPYASRAVESARRQGLLSVLPRVLETQAYELMGNSSFDLAYAAASEAYQLSLDVGHGGGWPLNDMAMVEAIWGREAEARRHAEEVLAIGQRTGSTFLAGVAEWTFGLIDLAAGRNAEAAERLLAATDWHRPGVNPLVAMPAFPDAAEAAARCGRAGELRERLAVFEGRARAAATGAQRALLARCQALLGTRPPQEAFDEAIEYAPAVPPFQRARTELLYGEWLRRARRRTDARGHLRTALETFRALGATPWAERAAAELRATGETARKREISATEQLTPQELQIAGLVTGGLTNKEIAAQLFLSPRTVDYHLRKVFTKLGITSRTELIRDGLPEPDRKIG
jgi:DNA-binding CsgD family transcriptional regulator/tetratricopeptide (TPR) repeat protein